MSLPPLATSADIVARLGRNLNQVESARIDALLMDGSAIIRRYCREDFTYYASDTVTIVADAGVMVLPWRPIASIASVTALSGTPGVSDFPVSWYVFDGIDTITIPDAAYSGILNLPEIWYQGQWYSESFRIVGAHGYSATPDDVMAVLCTAILSELATPTMSATLASESIGAYSYSMRRTSGAGLSAALIDAGMKTTLADYRKGQGTIAVKT